VRNEERRRKGEGWGRKDEGGRRNEERRTKNQEPRTRRDLMERTRERGIVQLSTLG
jgi:hypothetical protein